MSSDAHLTPTAANPRQWHRSHSRPPSSSSLSSSDPSRPVTPQDAVYPRLPSLRPPIPSRTFSVEQYASQKRLRELQGQQRVSSLGASSRLVSDEDDEFRPHTHTITPATVRHALILEKSDSMRLPFPGHSHRDSSSSTDSRPSYSGADSSQIFDEELGDIPPRHPLRNRLNSKNSSLLLAVREGRQKSPAKSLRARAHTYRPDSTSTQSSSSPPRTSMSLRLKPKKTNSQRSAMSLFKTHTPPSQPSFEDIEFDWAEQRRRELQTRASLLEQAYEGERGSMQAEIEKYEAALKVAQSDAGNSAVVGSRMADKAAPRPRSWELTPEELQLHRQQEEESRRWFIYKDRVWLNRSYVSPHSKESVPYPLAYDKVNIQTDRHSHDLLRQLFWGRPSIHDDESQRTPATVLDLGCGAGTWIFDAAQCWRNTLFYGLDLQSLHPPRAQLLADLGELADNIRFTYYNFLLDRLPYLDDKFDMVRMANLKWAIPEDKWDFVLQEVHRVLKRGGWVEIIDDDFLLGTSPNNMLSAEQRLACEALEAQFKDMLQERNLPLDTHGELMTDTLSRRFNAFDEDDFAVAISKSRPVSVEIHGQAPIQVMLPPEGMSHKAAKLMGIGLDLPLDKRHSGGSTRSRSESVRSADSHSTVSLSTDSHSATSSSTTSESTASHSTTNNSEGDEVSFKGLVNDENQMAVPPVNGLDKQLIYQPLGLDIHPGRFEPFPPAELNAHAVHNMQSIIACKEAIRGHELRICPELQELQVKDGLLPEERQRFETLSWEWNARRRSFDDAFWEFETAMLKRLGLPQRCFEDEDDEDFLKPTAPRPQAFRTASGLGKFHKSSDASLHMPSPTRSSFAVGSNVTVRLIRVHTGWK